MAIVAIVVALVPLVVAFEIARRQSFSAQTEKLSGLAGIISRRAEETAAQFARARADLQDGKYGAPGSESEIKRMRALTLTSNLLQAVGRMEGTKVICSSMGKLNPAVDLGKPDIVTINDVRIWTNIRPSFGGGATFHALESRGCVILIAPDLVLDLYSDETDLSEAVLTGNSHRVISKRGEISPAWLAHLGKAEEVSFVDNDSLVVVRRCRGIDIVSIVAQPIHHAYDRLAAACVILMPFGGLIGFLMAGLLFKTARRQQTLQSVMGAGLKSGEFFMHYQPLVELATGRIIGAEALIRWRRSTGEMIRPDIFIPAAEEAGLIGRVTDFVITEIMPAARRLSEARQGFYVGINITSADIKAGRVANSLVLQSTRHGVDLSNIGVEITESGLLDVDQACLELDSLREAGVKISMDDFGTGFSSLAYLMKLDVDCIKIDKLFVEAIGTGSATSHVIDHMIEMAKDLGKETVAEGVETAEQVSYLTARGVKYGQGYFFGKPMPLGELVAILETNQLTSHFNMAA